jgi:predicted nucleic acid-binding protein
MKAAIVDTDVVSMLFKGDTRSLAYRVHVTGRLLGISFMTLAELERWSLERGWGPKRKLELAEHVARYLSFRSAEICASSGPRSLSQRSEGATDSNRRCLDCGQRTLLSGTTHYQQSKRLFAH